MDAVDRILDLLASKGSARYGRECVSQTEHALQCAALAEKQGAADSLVGAALLHDLGHLFHKRDSAEMGQERDDRHEHIASGHLSRQFGAALVEPIRLHVDAKRWLCANEAGYFDTLSQGSVRSLDLQGGPFAANESDAFLKRPFASDAIALRRWDDLAKVPGAATRGLADYRDLLCRLVRAGRD
jgi:[1-hydroxy-2-(trimethylamino)ethyl]phosphonate dioxygenase